MEDVWGIGKVIGVKFTGDKANMFNVLSWGGRKGGRGDVGAEVDGGKGKARK